MNYPQENIKPYNAEEKKSVQVERMFDHIAPAYDGLNHALSLGIDRIWRRKAIRWLKQFHPRRIMDIATGTGDFAILACKMLHPDMLVGTDISAGMMQIGKEKARKAGLDEKITFAKEDCSALSFPDGNFDAATVAFGIRNFEDLDKALSEIHRVLAPHGVLAILELSTPELSWEECSPCSGPQPVSPMVSPAVSSSASSRFMSFLAPLDILLPV